MADLDRSDAVVTVDVETTASMEGALALLRAERVRQLTVEGMTAEQDDRYHRGELAQAAATYALTESLRIANRARPHVPWTWPGGAPRWKPSPTDRTRELAKAGALIVAELERLARQAVR